MAATGKLLLGRAGHRRRSSYAGAFPQGLRRLLGHPIVIMEDNISIQGNQIGFETTMSALITTLKSRLFPPIAPEDRLHALSVYGALIFIAAVVVSTFPHSHTF
jgi:hypothetical protein